MKLNALAAAACLLGITSTTVDAATVIFDDTTYEVTTLTGTLVEQRDVLEAQVWWDPPDAAIGSGDVAREFANLVGNAFGNVNTSPTRGPLFVHRAPEDLDPLYMEYWSFYPSTSEASFSGNNSGREYVFAVAVPVAAVPLPASSLLLLSSLTGIVCLRRRRQPD